MAAQLDFDYYQLYLRNFLTDIGDDRKDDIAFIKERASLANKVAIDSRRSGMTVDQAQQQAMDVLLEGFNE